MGYTAVALASSFALTLLTAGRLRMLRVAVHADLPICVSVKTQLDRLALLIYDAALCTTV